MNKPSKLPEIRKEAFTKAREGLGLSTKELSGMACLSVRQIEQIENGETSSYYGAQIKVTAAKKVAALLKLKEEDAFDFGDKTPLVKSIPEKEVEQAFDKAEKVVAPEKISKPQKVEETPKILIKKNPEPVRLFENSNAATKSNPKKKLFVLVGIAAAVLFSIVNLRPLFFPEPVKEEIVVAEAVQEAQPATAAVEEAKPAAPAQASTPAVEAAAPVATAAAVSSECPAVDVSVVTYKPEAPKKAGDMVYVQSKAPQTVCVTDATGKTQNKTLEPGVGASIYGKPPFKVLTLGLNQVDLYFQGAKVRTGSAAGKTIILEAAELSQPAAATDSQLR